MRTARTVCLPRSPYDAKKILAGGPEEVNVVVCGVVQIYSSLPAALLSRRIQLLAGPRGG